MFWLICRISPSITGIFTTSSAMLATSVFNWAASVEPGNVPLHVAERVGLQTALEAAHLFSD